MTTSTIDMSDVLKAIKNGKLDIEFEKAIKPIEDEWIKNRKQYPEYTFLVGLYFMYLLHVQESVTRDAFIHLVLSAAAAEVTDREIAQEKEKLNEH